MTPDMSQYIKKSEIVATSINKVPAFAGQIAVVGDTIYIANGTESELNWKSMATRPIDVL